MTILSENLTLQSLFYKISIAFVTVVIIALLFPKGESIESEVTEGTVWLNDELIAEFSFPIIKSEEIFQSELRAAENKVYPVFISNSGIVEKSTDSLKKYSNFLIEVLDHSADNDSIDIVNSTFLSSSSFEIFQSIRLKERNLINSGVYKLRNLFSGKQTFYDYGSR